MTTNPFLPGRTTETHANPFIADSPPATTTPEPVQTPGAPVQDTEPVQAVAKEPAEEQGTKLESHTPDQPEDEALLALVERARATKAVVDAATALYGQVKNEIWEASGHHVGKLPGGASFRAPSSSRRVDYKKLADQYPEVYAEVVSEREPEPGKMGSFYL